ncbi:MAG: hypothetical protein Q7T26_11400 [Dehalococcoidia bacterium]|nr:hypothetical protein [Dehalococcoidia bacterium]
MNASGQPGKSGDIILAVDGHAAKNIEERIRYLNTRDSGIRSS